MKFLIFSALCFFGIRLLSQTTPSVKYDSLVYLNNKNLTIVYLKGKSGIYDLEKKTFVNPLTTGHLQYLENADVIFQFTDKQIAEVIPGQAPKDFKQNNFKKDIYDPVNYKVYADGFESLSSNMLIVNQFLYPLEQYTALINSQMEDSLDKHGNRVYPPNDPGKQQSGVWDLKARRWLIAPKYRSVQAVGSHFFAFDVLNKDGQYAKPEQQGIDLYRLSGKKMDFVERIPMDKIGRDWSNILKDALAIDHVEKLNDVNDHYRLHQGAKVNIVRFTITNDLFYHVYIPNQWFDAIFINAEMNHIFTCSQGKLAHYTCDLEEDVYAAQLKKTGFNHAKIVSNAEGFFAEYDHSGATSSWFADACFSIEKLDNLMVVQNYSREKWDAQPLYTEYGEDSLYWDENGEYHIAFAAPEKGHNASGVYDLNTRKWIIPNTHFLIFAVAGKRYLVQDLDLDDKGLVQGETVSQRLVDAQGQEILSHEAINKLNRDEFAKLLLGGDEAYYSNFENVMLGSMLHRQDARLKYTRLQGGKQQIHKLAFYGGNRISEIHSLPGCNGEFVDINQTSYEWDSYSTVFRMIKLDRDTIAVQFSWDFFGADGEITTFKKPTKDFDLTIFDNQSYEYDEGALHLSKLVLLIHDKGRSYFKLHQNERKLTLHEIGDQEFNRLLLRSKFSRERFHKFGDALVVQKEPEVQENIVTPWFNDDDHYEYIQTDYAIGSSLIYKKGKTGWKPITQPLREIAYTDYGFLCKGSYCHEAFFAEFYYAPMKKNYVDSVNQTLFNLEEVDMLLNTKFEPFVWSNTSEFKAILEFDFGYQLFLDYNRSIFISKKGELITDEHFENFELIDGKIVGSSPELYEYDEFGEYVLDNSGNILVVSPAKRKMFPIK